MYIIRIIYPLSGCLDPQILFTLSQLHAAETGWTALKTMAKTKSVAYKSETGDSRNSLNSLKLSSMEVMKSGRLFHLQILHRTKLSANAS